MFYQIDNTPPNQMDRDLFLVSNFLNKISVVTYNIAKEFHDLTIEIPQLYDLNISEVVDLTFKKNLSPILTYIELEFSHKKANNHQKLVNNELTGENLKLKLTSLDALFIKGQDSFVNLMNGESSSFDLFRTLTDQLKSFLKSILSCFGFCHIIFDEVFDLLTSFSEMYKRILINN
jgi:hypothetical protein